ncbi:prion-inhibition and propagation-domain-containing protein [Annulohypoxylon moriforme]|nr:prion-inhibition and propagation-domain-containing protein [Annulohypoxylon moriforme]
MAEVAATAIGIAGVVSVLQSLLQCYKDFLTARNFEGDYAYLQLRAALLENSTATWAIAVGLIDDSGAPSNKFLVARPTEDRAGYTSDTPTSQNISNAEESPSFSLVSPEQNDKHSRTKRIANGLHRVVHKRHSEKLLGVMKQTVWALVDKARLEANLNKVTMLVDRLNIDFTPVNQKQQLDKYYQTIKNIDMCEEDLSIIGEIPSDQISRRVLKMLENERLIGNRFIVMNVSKEGTVNIGDHYDKDWRGESTIWQQARNDTYENLSVTDMAFVNIGVNFGGKSPVQIRLEQLTAARQTRNEGFLK